MKIQIRIHCFETQEIAQEDAKAIVKDGNHEVIDCRFAPNINPFRPYIVEVQTMF